ncbi:hypothetical protein M407DRAFT_25957 [Tulasnella calospora MUT 4182]|uniref:Retrotransposon gag domain-containing protein n=1 Tax=Tulasnella calospora MUT 4182 TaxID=1051891 RepID=A0A0C3LTA3_9AGAM|nr:hypothetical protein M407DRAFT_25957 [Tulasnella calospora MUT 4182]
MADDALAWWSALDEEVQGSWKLLRQAMLSTYRPMFYGGSGEEAENFICAVRDKAINEKKRTDNEWIVMYAESCLAGEALRWYTYLDLDTKNSWEKLQQALLTQYSRGGPADPALNLVPTPASAASVGPAPSAIRRGRIRISNSTSSIHHYLSKNLIENRVITSSFLTDALELEWIPSSYGLQTLSIPGSQIPGYNLLGMKWFPDDPPGGFKSVPPATVDTFPSSVSSVLFICAVDSHTNSTALNSARGTLLTNNWKISIEHRTTGEIIRVSAMAGSGAVRILAPWHAVSYWANFRCPKEPVYPGWNSSGGGVWLAAGNADQGSRAEFFFEPI